MIQKIFEDVTTPKAESLEFKRSNKLPDESRKENQKYITIWLLLTTLGVIAMIILGGLTRLNDSGLSITTWAPITGIIPPFASHDWQRAFEMYQKTPEFIHQNFHMTLGEFKTIYWWEWGHRLLGRIVGLGFLLPFLWFTIKKKLPLHCRSLCFIILVLLGLQGVIGWWMVQSGLVDTRTDVSPVRLAVHLCLALIILMYLVWTIAVLKREDWSLVSASRIRNARVVWYARCFLLLSLLQLFFGALVSGSDAGKVYTDWPWMEGSFFPSDSFFLPSPFYDVYANLGLVQFIHRLLAYILIFFSALFWLKTRRMTYGKIGLWSGKFFTFLVVQMVIGISTLYSPDTWITPLLHQLTAICIVIILVRTYFEASYPAELLQKKDKKH